MYGLSDLALATELAPLVLEGLRIALPGPSSSRSSSGGGCYSDSGDDSDVQVGACCGNNGNKISSCLKAASDPLFHIQAKKKG